MLCVEKMSSGPHTYQNVVNIDMLDMRDWLLGLLPAHTSKEAETLRCIAALAAGASHPARQCLTSGGLSPCHGCSSQHRDRRSVQTVEELPAPGPLDGTLSQASQGNINLANQLAQVNFKNAIEVRYFERLLRNHRLLVTSGLYYDGLDMKMARKRLKHCAAGSFLVRSSSDSRFLFAISVTTHRGPTSVRIVYSKGRFRLDCEAHFEDKMPRFTNVIELIQHYMKNSGVEAKERSQCFWLETSGRRDEPVVLTTPQKHSISSLKHLCRRAVHMHCDLADSNDLMASAPRTIMDYLKEYPYWL